MRPSISYEKGQRFKSPEKETLRNRGFTFSIRDNAVQTWFECEKISAGIYPFI